MTFIDWPGCKQSSYGEIIDKFPIRFNNYYEPFLGSGAVFFNLFRKGRIFNGAYLSDSNKRLIAAYNAVKDDPERVAKVLTHCLHRHSEQFYNAMCLQADGPATFLYLNRAADGKYSEDSEGNFNVPWNTYKWVIRKAKISKNVESIGIASRYLNLWAREILPLKWEQALTTANAGDVVYCNPPPRFPEDERRYLANYLAQLKLKGVHVFV